MDSTIPVQNVYYLLCYAWNKLEEGEIVDVATLDSTQLVDLFAKVLLGGTRHLIRRGFDRGYISFTEVTSRPRGRIEFANSLQRNLLQQGRVYCSFDELDHNVLHNRILKTTIKHLTRTERLATDLRDGLSETLRLLREVDDVILSRQIFRRVQLNRNNRYYDFLLKICELVYDNLLIDERSGQSRFRDFLQDEPSMARLFEAFVRNFYRLEQHVFDVQALKIKWHIEWADEESRSYLPEMRTDVCLISDERKIILDCKYYKETLQLRYGKRSIHSGHLYQLNAYLTNKEGDPGWDKCEGLLLYPNVGERVDLSYQMHGHLVQVKTIDLSQDWHSIDRDMRRIIGV